MSDDQTPEMIANPAELAAPSIKPTERSALPAPTFVGFPKLRFHPVLGRGVANDPNELAAMTHEAGWRDTPEEADQNRTWTEAQEAQFHNMRMKLQAHDDAGHEIVRNSVQADEKLRQGNAEPL